jgi:hypothetical protein
MLAVPLYVGQQEPRCDVFHLVTGVEPMLARGWAWWEELIRPENIRPVARGYPPEYCLTQGRLHPIRTPPSWPEPPALTLWDALG